MGDRRAVSFAPPLSERAQARVALPFLLATLIWGSTWLVIETQLPYAPAAWSITWRFGLASVAMVAVALARGERLAIGRPAHMLAVIVGATQFTLNYLFVYAAEGHIASGLVALISALMIVPNALFGRAFLGQAVSRRFLIGSVIAVAGIVFLFGDALARTADPAGSIFAGVALSVAGALAASIGNVLQATRRARATTPSSLLAWSMAYGALFDAAYAWASIGAPRFSLAPVYLAGLLYLVVAGSAVAFSCYFHVIRVIGPARAGYVGVLIPTIAMALSTMFESYRWTVGAAAGVALTLGGLLVAIRARSPAR